MVGSALLLANQILVAQPGLGPLEASVQACTSWIAEPVSWAEGVEDFPANTGLDQSGLFAVNSVPPFALPPPPARQNMHHWQIGKMEEAYFITASDTVPVCHIVGGGSSDLYLSVERLLGLEGFDRLWKQEESKTRGDMMTRSYSFVVEPDIRMHLSHASDPGGRTDRPQIIATVVYQLEN
jgi:hypothetical protein